eukprot:gene1065-860_t
MSSTMFKTVVYGCCVHRGFAMDGDSRNENISKLQDGKDVDESENDHLSDTQDFDSASQDKHDGYPKKFDEDLDLKNADQNEDGILSIPDSKFSHSAEATQSFSNGHSDSDDDSSVDSSSDHSRPSSVQGGSRSFVSMSSNARDEQSTFESEPVLNMFRSSLGQTKGAYTIEALLGEGVFGVVFQVSRTDGPGEKFAMKELKASKYKSYEEMITKSEKEAGNLADQIHKQTQIGVPWPVDTITNWFEQILSGLEYCHSQNVIHSDLNPSNILLKKQLVGPAIFKITDFGFATALAHQSEYVVCDVGTASYMSPQAHEGEPCSTKTDVWSLGCILFEICVLSLAFETTGDVYSKYPEIPEVSPNGDDWKEFQHICSKILIKEPASDRFSCPMLREELARLRNPSSGVSSIQHDEEQVAVRISSAERMVPRKGGIAFVSVALVAIACTYFNSGSNDLTVFHDVRDHLGGYYQQAVNSFSYDDCRASGECMDPSANKEPVSLPGLLRLRNFISSGHVAGVAEVLSEFQIDLNEQVIDEDDNFPLHLAASQGQSGVVELLLTAGARTDVTQHDGYTALHEACKIGHFPGEGNHYIAVAEMLIAAGAPLDAKTNVDGRTALDLVISVHDGSRNSEKFVKVLVDGGASVHVVNNEGLTPLHMISNTYDTKQVASAKTLLDAGAYVDAQTPDGSTSLHIAAGLGFHTDLIQFLIDSGADVEARNADGATPLCLAATKSKARTGYSGMDPDRHENVKLLIENGALVDVVDDNGWTVFHYAVHGGSVETIELIFTGVKKKYPDDYKSKMRKKNKDGHIPIQVADNLRQNGIVKMFQSLGINLPEK